MNFAKLVTEAQRLAGRVDSSFNERTKNWINEALQRWATKDPWGTLSGELDITNYGTRDLYLPGYVGKIVSVFDKTNYFPVIRKENWDRNAPTPYGQQTSGKPYYWREMGFSPVAREPITLPQFVKFTPRTGDVTTTCYVEGLISTSSFWSGVSGPALIQNAHREYVTIYSGTSVSSAQKYHKVFTVGKVEQTTHEVLVNWDVDAAVLEPTEYQSKYRHLQLLYVPTSGAQFTIKYVRKLERLEGDNQFPPPSVNPHFLIWWAAGNIHSAMKEMDNAREKWSMAEKFLAEDAHHEEAHGDQDTSSIPDVALWGVGEEEGWTP